MTEAYTPDLGWRGKVRRRAVRFAARRPAPHGPARGMFTVTFDDAPASAAEAGAEVLEARGVRATYFIATGLCGAVGHMGRFASLEQVADLHARGHEVGCHTRSHLDCARQDAAAITAELDANARVLADVGVVPATFAYPYGELGVAAKRLVGSRFSVGRTAAAGLLRGGSDLAQAPAVGVEGPGGEARALAWLRRAAEARAWVMLFSHDVRDAPSPWGCTPAALARVTDAALALGLAPVTAAEGARALGVGREAAV